MSRTCFDCKNYDEKSQAGCELDSEDRRACCHYNLKYYKAKDIVKSNETFLGGRNMELKDTIDLMQPDDYKERFIAEYGQTKIRYDKLHAMIVKYEAGTLDFTPKCSIDLLKEQASYMGKYLYTLEIRAEIEGIVL